MIQADNHWFHIFSKDINPLLGITGKWLHFDDTEHIHRIVNDIDKLVENGSIRLVKVARKLPEYDPFPDKPCVLCAFTSDDKEEKIRVKNILRETFGILVKVWKSEEQTSLDWQENGLLFLEHKITKIKREMKSGKFIDAFPIEDELDRLEKELQQIKRNIDDPIVIAEIHLSTNTSSEKIAENHKSYGHAEYHDLLSRVSRLEQLMTKLAGPAATNIIMSDEIAKIKQHRLQILEQQAAAFGVHSPPHIIMEIENLRKELGTR
jgi:hypothetical protein